MNGGQIVGNLDVTELLWWAFVLFFIALIFYLRREDRREGYPVEDELTGLVDTPGGPLSRADEKIFKLPNDRGYRTPGQGSRDPVKVDAKRSFNAGGAPYVPNGDPLNSGMGPGSYANRDKLPDLDAHGRPRIVPISTAPEISVSKRDPDPRGMTVLGMDGKAAGKVVDMWVDRAEHIIRYLAVAMADGGNVLVPMAMAKLKAKAGTIMVDALKAEQFAGAPRLTAADTITRYEEERVVAYFGGGYLYADAQRAEPLV